MGRNHREHDKRPTDPFEDIGFPDIPEQLKEASRKKPQGEDEAGYFFCKFNSIRFPQCELFETQL